MKKLFLLLLLFPFLLGYVHKKRKNSPFFNGTFGKKEL